jgi:hypothetical protein
MVDKVKNKEISIIILSSGIFREPLEVDLETE